MTAAQDLVESPDIRRGLRKGHDSPSQHNRLINGGQDPAAHARGMTVHEQFSERGINGTPNYLVAAIVDQVT